MKEKKYRDLAQALEVGLNLRYGGQFRVEVKNFKQEHETNPFCAINTAQLVIYTRYGSLISNGPQQDLFANNGHAEPAAVNANDVHQHEPWEAEYVEAPKEAEHVEAH